ncbi:hypothetical protein MBLNU13_g10976t2 [Cladosporium sp. NU13]
MLGTNFKKAISASNAKSRLLSLPPELRLRIFEYVFGTVRHHVKINGDDKNYHVQLARCEVEHESGHHTYRNKTLEEIASSLQNQSDNSQDPPHRLGHLPCHRQSKSGGRRLPAKGHKRRLPQSLLLTCKAINEDAALIMWHNHVFELELFSADLEKFVNRMTAAQRNAIRAIAFDVRAAATPFCVPVEVIDKTFKRGTYHVVGDWIRLLQRQDVEDVDVRVEEGGVMGSKLSIGRNRPIPISTQQRLEYEGQIELIVGGRVLDLNAERLPLVSGAESVRG